MKGTENFKNVILKYLTDRVEFDTTFAAAFAKEGKTIDDCIIYIVTTVQKSGCNGFEDEEIFNMAAEYYTKDNVESGTMPQVKIVTNHKVELTDQELAEIRQKAIDEAIAAKKKQITAKTTAKKPSTENAQISLF